MTFIDWSDAEGMLGLLVELAADASAECRDDPERQRFLVEILAELRAVEARLPEISAPVLVRTLVDLHESADPAFAGDPVMVHVADLIDELEQTGKA